MDKNENGIRWFETQYSANCRYTNTIRHLSEWTKDFKPDGQSQVTEYDITLFLLNDSKEKLHIELYKFFVLLFTA